MPPLAEPAGKAPLASPRSVPRTSPRGRAHERAETAPQVSLQQQRRATISQRMRAQTAMAKARGGAVLEPLSQEEADDLRFALDCIFSDLAGSPSEATLRTIAEDLDLVRMRIADFAPSPLARELLEIFKKAEQGLETSTKPSKSPRRQRVVPE